MFAVFAVFTVWSGVVCGMWGVEDELRMAVVRVLLSKRELRT
jgi:hypothetical protein